MSNNHNFNFGNRFKELRLEKNLTQSELVKDFNQRFYRNYTATAISHYENNKRFPEIYALKDFADYFDVSVAYLIGEAETRKIEKSHTDIFRDEVKAHIAKELYPFIEEQLIERLKVAGVNFDYDFENKSDGAS